MAPNPTCSALASAKEKKGLSYAAIATQIGQSEQRVIDICTGSAAATTDEFNALTRVLDITTSPPSTTAHHPK